MSALIPLHDAVRSATVAMATHNLAEVQSAPPPARRVKYAAVGAEANDLDVSWVMRVKARVLFELIYLHSCSV